MGKKKALKLPLIPEKRLEPLRAEVERLGDEQDYAFPGLSGRPYYDALVYYMMFTHLLEPMRERLGGIDDDRALANAYFWYSVVFEWSFRIEPGSNPLEGEMDAVEGAPSLHFDEEEYVALWHAAAEYVTRRRAGAVKASATRKRRAAGAKAAQTRKRRAAGPKVAATRKAK